MIFKLEICTLIAVNGQVMKQWHALRILMHCYGVVLSDNLREMANGGNGYRGSGFGSNADDVDRPLQIIIFLRILRLAIQGLPAVFRSLLKSISTDYKKYFRL